MIQCDVCYLIVTKVAYCTPACKQKAFRKNLENPKVQKETPTYKIEPGVLVKDKGVVKALKPCRHGLGFCRECL